jgi:hypothetical protein
MMVRCNRSRLRTSSLRQLLIALAVVLFLSFSCVPLARSNAGAARVKASKQLGSILDPIGILFHCLDSRGVGIPCVTGDHTALEVLSYELAQLQQTIQQNQQVVLSRFNDLENLMLEEQRSRFNAELSALDLNGQDAVTAVEALANCAQTTTSSDCAAYIGGTTTEPLQPAKQAIMETEAYLTEQIGFLPQNIDTTMALFTGTKAGSYDNGMAYLSWYGALRTQDQATGHPGRDISNPKTPVVGAPMATAVNQDLSYYSKLLQRYGFLMVTGATMANDNARAKSYQVQVDRYLNGTSRGEVQGSIDYFDVPALLPDQFLFSNGNGATIVAAKSEPKDSTKLTAGTVSALSKTIGSYANVGNFLTGTATDTWKSAGSPAYGAFNVWQPIEKQKYNVAPAPSAAIANETVNVLTNGMMTKNDCATPVWPTSSAPTWQTWYIDPSNPYGEFGVQTSMPPQWMSPDQSRDAYEPSYFSNSFVAATNGLTNRPWAIRYVATNVPGGKEQTGVVGTGAWVTCVSAKDVSHQVNLAKKPPLLG